MSRLKFRPEEGMEVIATGKLTTYPGTSNYQIVIDNLEPAGAGALMALLEERKRRLAAEGLFDAGAQAAPALHAARHRRHHLADRRGHPRHHPPHQGPLPAACAGLAGARAGRDRGRGGDRGRATASTRSPGTAPSRARMC